jgi:hypothetical protein
MVADKILTAPRSCGAQAAERKPVRPQLLGRILSGLFMGSLTLCLIGLIAAVGPTAALFLVQLILPVAIIAIVLVVSLSLTARAVWGRLCLINGIVSIAVAAASVEGRGQPLWPADPTYEHTLDRAMQWWLGELISTAATYFSAAMIAAATLLALSYWLLRSPHGSRRDAH